MKVDIHIHTAKYSMCAVEPADMVVEKAIKRGIDAVIFTEHDILWDKNELLKLQSSYPDILILNGVEIWTTSGYDVLVYGNLGNFSIPDDLIKEDYFSSETELPTGMSVEKLLDRLEPEGCAFVLAHPFRYSSSIKLSDETLRRFHAIEADSSNFNYETTPLSVSLAGRLSIPTTIASDSHSVKSVGLWHIETPDFKTMEEFVLILKSGKWTHKSVS